MPAPGQNAIDKHPERAKIIDCLLARKYTEAAQIAGVSRQAVSKYCQRHLQPALQVAARVLQSERGLPQVANSVASVNFGQEQVALARKIREASPFRDRLELMWDETLSGVKSARDAVRTVVDSEGNERAIGRDMGPLAPLLAQAHKNLEILGRATGELDSAGVSSLTISNTVVLVPTIHSAADAVDVTPKR